MEKYLHLRYLVPTLSAIVFSYLTTPYVITLAKKIVIIDDPKTNIHEKVIHTYPTPRGGGIAIAAGIIITSLIFIPIDKYLIAILLGALLITILGVLDDKYNINPYARLVAQFAIACIPIAAGIGIAYITGPYKGTIDLSYPQISFFLFGRLHSIWVLSDLFALIWIVFLMNILNMGAKGVDGQLPGVVTIAAFCIALLSLKFSADITQWPIIILALITAGAFLGFLPWNFYPQKIMPSYSGSTLAGYMLAILSILSTAKVGTLFVVLGIPLVDTGYTIVRRIMRGKSPVWGDRGHLHHKLYDAGWSKRKIAITYWIGTALLGILALNLKFIFTLVAVIILRIPSLFEPYYYGDEMIYLTLGQGIRQGVTLYKDLHDNKPPLLYVIAAIAGSLFWFKVILAGWMIATIIIFWKFIEKLFPKKEKLHLVSTVIFALLTTLPLFEGNIANAELFLIGPTIWAFYILLFKKQNLKNLLSAGVLFSVSTLFKVPAVFDIGAIVAFWFIYAKYTKAGVIQVVKNLFIVFLGFITPILITVIYYFLKGALHDYLVAAFLQNLGYLSTWRGQTIKQASFFVRNVPLFIKFGIVVLINVVLYLKRKSLPKEFVFITSWALFSAFAIALSERPYPHYFVQVLAPVSILFGLLFTDKSVIQSLSLIPLGIVFFVPFYYKFWYYPTSTYYLRFINFATGQISKDDYFNSFNQNLNRNYQVANLIANTTTKNQRVFIWGDGTMLYALSRRLPPIKYTADYHINDFSSPEEVISGLTKNPPTTVVVLPEAPAFPQLNTFLTRKYILLYESDGVEIWKILKPEVKAAITTDSF